MLTDIAMVIILGTSGALIFDLVVSICFWWEDSFEGYND